jgi:hypothetical protein
MVLDAQLVKALFERWHELEQLAVAAERAHMHRVVAYFRNEGPRPSPEEEQTAQALRKTANQHLVDAMAAASGDTVWQAATGEGLRHRIFDTETRRPGPRW